MSIFRVIFEFFLIYMVYKLIVDFIIPVYRATRQMKNTIHKAQEHMKNQQANTTSHPVNVTPKGDHDYIEYEEVK